MLHRTTAALAITAMALAASGCGSSSKDGSTSSSATPSAVASNTGTQVPASSEEIKVQSGKPLSRAVWIKKGDKICAATNVKLSSTTAKNEADFARLLPQASGYERIEATELSKLVPPKDMARDWQQIITELQKFSEFSLRAGEYARVKNFGAMTPIGTAANKTQQEMVAIAKRDGFKACSIP